ncbi:hypothetical protein HanRHA438_Chr05g0222621 [Helianthus annuus]|nr:hypothetical protein HanRHA438_Chr05g0222621 [Helianthus annuus]
MDTGAWWLGTAPCLAKICRKVTKQQAWEVSTGACRLDTSPCGQSVSLKNRFLPPVFFHPGLMSANA